MCNTFYCPPNSTALMLQQLESTLTVSSLLSYPCVWIGGPAQLWGRLCCVQQHHWQVRKHRQRQVYQKTVYNWYQQCKLLLLKQSGCNKGKVTVKLNLLSWDILSRLENLRLCDSVMPSRAKTWIGSSDAEVEINFVKWCFFFFPFVTRSSWKLIYCLWNKSRMYPHFFLIVFPMQYNQGGLQLCASVKANNWFWVMMHFGTMFWCLKN